MGPVGAGCGVLAGRETKRLAELGQGLTEDERRGGGLGVRDRQGERGSLHGFDGVLNGVGAPTR